MYYLISYIRRFEEAVHKQTLIFCTTKCRKNHIKIINRLCQFRSQSVKGVKSDFITSLTIKKAL